MICELWVEQGETCLGNINKEHFDFNTTATPDILA